jgi:hypothetical protein
MQTGDFYLLESIAEFLRQLPEIPRYGSVDDQLQVSCAIAWLEYFGVEISPRTRILCRLVSFNETLYQRYAAELAEVRSLKQKRSEHIRANNTGEHTADVVIDLHSQTIHTKTKPMLRDPQLLATIHLLSSNDRVSLDELCQRVFGFRAYRADRHLARVNNLFTKFNQSFAPYFKLRKKSGFLYLEGDRSRLSLRESSPLYAQAMSLNGKKETRQNPTPMPELTERNIYTRKDLQTVWGVSKSQALYEIETYLEANALSKSGTGKAVRYDVRDLNILKPLKH